MNRKIEFRGLTEDGKWVYGNLVYTISMNNSVQKHHTLIGINLDLTEVIFETIGQYIGEKDTNDNKVFKGDIIEFYLEGKCYKDSIKYRYGMFYVNNPLSTGWREIPIRYLDGDYTVIGTIHDNKLKER